MKSSHLVFALCLFLIPACSPSYQYSHLQSPQSLSAAAEVFKNHVEPIRGMLGVRPQADIENAAFNAIAEFNKVGLDGRDFVWSYVVAVESATLSQATAIFSRQQVDEFTWALMQTKKRGVNVERATLGKQPYAEPQWAEYTAGLRLDANRYNQQMIHQAGLLDRQEAANERKRTKMAQRNREDLQVLSAALLGGLLGAMSSSQSAENSTLDIHNQNILRHEQMRQTRALEGIRRNTTPRYRPSACAFGATGYGC